ncbi:unnamed protein product [Toxocara canis]|uniref:Uncharacterized protein n=1 Tax=Toxocara canis TaxID=6265 RepID=A0A183VGB1_TOXCA|nr:unnamed protein product [Toxocara canis]
MSFGRRDICRGKRAGTFVKEAALASDLAWDEASAWSGNGKKSTKNGKKSFGALILSEIMLTKFSRLHFPAS